MHGAVPKIGPAKAGPTGPVPPPLLVLFEEENVGLNNVYQAITSPCLYSHLKHLG